MYNVNSVMSNERQPLFPEDTREALQLVAEGLSALRKSLDGLREARERIGEAEQIVAPYPLAQRKAAASSVEGAPRQPSKEATLEALGNATQCLGEAEAWLTKAVRELFGYAGETLGGLQDRLSGAGEV